MNINELIKELQYSASAAYKEYAADDQDTSSHNRKRLCRLSELEDQLNLLGTPRGVTIDMPTSPAYIQGSYYTKLFTLVRHLSEVQEELSRLQKDLVDALDIAKEPLP